MKILRSLVLLVTIVSYCSNEVPKIADVLTQRYSGYVYDNERTVTIDQIESIIRAAQLAPSLYNDQPWYFIICDRTTNPEAYDKVFNTLVEFNQSWAKNAPVLIVSIASTNSHQGEFNQWAQIEK